MLTSSHLVRPSRQTTCDGSLSLDVSTGDDADRISYSWSSSGQTEPAVSCAMGCQCEELSREGRVRGRVLDWRTRRRDRDGGEIRENKSSWTAMTQDVRARDEAVGCLRDSEERGRTRHVVDVEAWAARIVKEGID